MTVRFRIDDVPVEATDGEWLLDVARRFGFEIPSLCHHQALEPIGACRVCLVEVTDDDGSHLSTSCNRRVEDGIEVATDTEAVRRHRAMSLELLLARAPESTRIRQLAARFGVTRARFGPPAYEPLPNCILCELCVRTCAHLAHHALTTVGRGNTKRIGLPFNRPATDCVGCGACASVCPADCIPVKDTAADRTIWGQRFDWVSCRECGASVITVKHRDFAVATKGLAEGYYDHCESCKQAGASKRFAAVAW